MPQHRFADPHHCPACGGRIMSGVCTQCALDLGSDQATRVWTLSVEADEVLERRRLALNALIAYGPRVRALGQPQTAPTPDPVPAAVAVPVPPAPVAVPPALAPPRAPRPPRPSLIDRIGIQWFLVGLGALLLGVSAVVFLLMSWGTLTLALRALVIVATTTVVMAASAALQRWHVPASANSLGSLGVLLLLLDCWAARSTGLVGTSLPAPTYFAVSMVLIAAVAGAVGVVSKVRALTVAGAVALLAAPIAAAWNPSGGIPHFGWGLTAAGALGLLYRLPLLRRWGLERRVLWAGGALAAVTASLVAMSVLTTSGLWQGPALGLTTAITLGANAVTLDRSTRLARLRFPAVLSALTGFLIAFSALRCVPVEQRSDGILQTLAVSVALLAPMVVSRLTRRPAIGGCNLTWIAWGTTPFTAFWALNSTGFTLTTMLQNAMRGVLFPWQNEPGLDLFHTKPSMIAIQVILTIAAVTAWYLTRSRAWGIVSTSMASVSTMTIAAAVGHSTWLQVALTMVLSVALVAGAGWCRHQRKVSAPLLLPFFIGGSLLLSTGILTSWALQYWSVPCTMVGIVGLLVLRREQSWSAIPAGMGIILASAIVVGALARWCGVSLTHTQMLTVALPAALVALAAFLPWPAVSERRWLSGGGFLASVLGATVLTLVMTPAQTWTLAAWLVAIVVVAAVNPRHLRSSKTITWWTLAATLGVLGLAMRGAALWTPLSPIVAGAAVALLAALVLLFTTKTDPRRAWLGYTAVGSGLVLCFLAGPSFAGDTAYIAWGTWLLVAGATLITAITVGPRLMLWGTWALVTLAWCSRLHDGQVITLEWYTLPPAALILAFGAWQAQRRAARWDRPLLLAGVAISVLPSVVAGVSGSLIRPAILTLLAVLAVVCQYFSRHTASGSTVPLSDEAHTHVSKNLPGLPRLMGAIALAAGAGGFLRWGAEVVLDPTIGSAFSFQEVLGISAIAVMVMAVLMAGTSLGYVSTLTQRQVTTIAVLAALAGLLSVMVAIRVHPLADPSPTIAGIRLLATAVICAAASMWSMGFGATRKRDLWWATGFATSALAAGIGFVMITPVPAEVFTVIPAAVLLVDGVRQLRTQPERGSWAALLSGLLVLVVPLTALDTVRPTALRVAEVSVVAVAVLWWGFHRRLRAPLVVGAVALVVHAIIHLGPVMSQAVAGVPRWASLGAAGVLLLVLGIRYEWGLAQLKTWGHRFSQLR